MADGQSQFLITALDRGRYAAGAREPDMSRPGFADFGSALNGMLHEL